MKQLFFVTLILSFGTASAQNMGYAYDFIKLNYKNIPLHASMPYYDTTVSIAQKSRYQKLTENASAYFEAFETKEINHDEHVYTAKSCYTYSTIKTDDIEHSFTVSYTIEMHVKKRYFIVSMHDFTMNNQERFIDFRESFKSADKNNGICNQFLAFFHDRNNDEIEKLCKAVCDGEIMATASK